MATITVVCTTKNIENYIHDCLSSIIEDQGWDEDFQLDLIVVDNGSTDSTREIVKSFLHDGRVRLIDNLDLGGGSSRNMGIELARGEFLAFVDGDDLVPPNSYRKMWESLQESGSDIVLGNYLHFNSKRAWRQNHLWFAPAKGLTLSERPSLIRSRVVWNKLYRTDFLRSAKVVFPDVPRANDIVAMTTAILAAKTMDVIPDNIYLYRHRPGSSSMTSNAGNWRGYKSYLSQECICAKLVAPTKESAIYKSYCRFAMKRLFGGTSRFGHYYAKKIVLGCRWRAKKFLRIK